MQKFRRSGLISLIIIAWAACMGANDQETPNLSATSVEIDGDRHRRIVTCNAKGDCTNREAEPDTYVTADGTVYEVPHGFALDVDGTIFFRGSTRTRPFQEAIWSRQPSEDEIDSAYPQGASGGAYGSLRCSAAANRTLENCRVDVLSPRDGGFDRTFLALAGMFRLSLAGPPISEIDWVSLDMRLGDGSGERPPCPGAPFCVLHINPPPPPPGQSPPSTAVSARGVVVLRDAQNPREVVWGHRPTEWAFDQIYRMEFVDEADATIRCAAPSRRLDDCSINSISTLDLRVGRAMLDLATLYQLAETAPPSSEIDHVILYLRVADSAGRNDAAARPD